MMVDDQLPHSFDRLDESARLSAFLEKLPTPTLCTGPTDNCYRNLVFWNQDESPQNNIVSEKIKSLLLKLRTPMDEEDDDLLLLFQFWALVMIDGEQLLTTWHQPFVLSYVDKYVCEHRLRSMNYKLQLNKTETVSENKEEENRRQTLISVFLNHLPGSCTDTKTESVMWPLFESSGLQCVGVLEFVSDFFYGFKMEMLRELRKIILEDGYLRTYDVQQQLSQQLPYITTNSVQQANSQLEKALEMVCESHCINLAQTWIPLTTRTGKRVALRLAKYFNDFDDVDEDFFTLARYTGLSDMFPLEDGKGLVWKSLLTHKPCFCKDTSAVSDIDKPFSIMTLDESYECFAICLNSTHTGNLDYVLEFYWYRTRDKMILLEGILMTLKLYLPSFKIVSGEELGEQLCVLEIIKDSLEIEHQSLIILEEQTRRNEMPMKKYKTAPIPLSYEVIIKEIKAGRTMEKAAQNLEVSVNTLKRRCKDHGISWPRPENVKLNECKIARKNMSSDIGAIQIELFVNQELMQDATTLIIKSQHLISYPSGLRASTSIVDVDDQLPESFDNQSFDDRLSTFLEKLPTRTPTPTRHQNCVVWSQNESPQNNLISNNSVPEKIKSLLLKLILGKYILILGKNDFLVQFWAPVTIDGQQLLTTFDQPFALTDLRACLCRHRLRSLNYKLELNGTKKLREEEEEDGRTLISVFLNCLPRDCSTHTGLAHVMWPIYEPSRLQCAGVLEFVFPESDKRWHYYAFVYFKEIISQQEDLRVYDVQERLSDKKCLQIFHNTLKLTTDGLRHAKNELEKALKMVCESFYIDLAQTWIPEYTRTKERVALRLTNYHMGRVTVYRSWCKLYPLEEEKGLVWKALLTHKPCLSRVKDNRPFLLSSSCIWEKENTCFAICLNSTHTGNLDHVLEFYWSETRDKMILLEAILKTLKRYLPSFKVVSGEKLGEQICVLDIKDFSEKEHQSFTVCKDMAEVLTQGVVDAQPNIDTSNPSEQTRRDEMQKRKHDTTPKELSKEDIMKEINAGKTMEKAAENLKASVTTLKRRCKDYCISWPRPKHGKNVSDSCSGQMHMSGDTGAVKDNLFINQEAMQDATTLTIKAKYRDLLIKCEFDIPTATLMTVQEKIAKKLNLKIGTFTLKYEDEQGDWIAIIDDSDLMDCIKSSKKIPNGALVYMVVAEQI